MKLKQVKKHLIMFTIILNIFTFPIFLTALNHEAICLTDPTISSKIIDSIQLSNYQPEKGLTVLFDVFHDNDSDSIAENYLDFKNCIQDLEINIYELNNTITMETIHESSLLILPDIEKELSQEEIQAITNYVLQGKSLLIIGNDDEDFNNQTITNLLQQINIPINISGTISGIQQVNASFEHPITSGLKNIYMNSPITFNVSPPAYTILEKNGKPVAAVWSKIGKIVIIGDEEAFTNYIDMNEQFCKQLVEWLLKPVVVLNVEDEVSAIQGEHTNITITLNNTDTTSKSVKILLNCTDINILSQINITIPPLQSKTEKITLNISDNIDANTYQIALKLYIDKHQIWSSILNLKIEPMVEVTAPLNIKMYQGDTFNLSITLRNRRTVQINGTLIVNGTILEKSPQKIQVSLKPGEEKILNIELKCKESTQAGLYEIFVYFKVNNKIITITTIPTSVSNAIEIEEPINVPQTIIQNKIYKITFKARNLRQESVNITIKFLGDFTRTPESKITLKPGENQVEVEFKYISQNILDFGSKRMILEIFFAEVLILSKEFNLSVKPSVFSILILVGLPATASLTVVSSMFLRFREKGKKRKKLINLLITRRYTPLKEIIEVTGFKRKEALEELKKIEKNKIINGYFDEETETFVILDKQLLQDLVNEIKNAGIISLATLRSKFGIYEKYLMKLIDQIVMKGALNGIFSTDKSKFMIFDALEEEISNYINKQGFTTIPSICEYFGIPEQILMDIIKKALKEERIEAHILDDKRIYTLNGLKNLLIEKINKKGIIDIKKLSAAVNLPENLILSTLRKLEDEGSAFSFIDDTTGLYTLISGNIGAQILRDLKTKGRTTIRMIQLTTGLTPEKISEIIKSIAQYYDINIIKSADGQEIFTEDFVASKLKEILFQAEEADLREISAKINVSFYDVTKIVEKLIGKGDLIGALTPTKDKYIKEITYITPPARKEIPTYPKLETVEEPQIVREYDFAGGNVRFKVAVRNLTSLVINDVEVRLNIPKEFRLVNILPSNLERDLNKGTILIGNISPGESFGVEYYLEPIACGRSKIAGIVSYKSATGELKATVIRPKEVQIKCPLVFKPEEANIAMVRNLYTKIKVKDYKRFGLNIPAQEAFELLNETIMKYDVQQIELNIHSEKPFKAEAWFYTRTKVLNNPVIMRTKVLEEQGYLDVEITCPDTSELTGLLAKISEDFKNLVKQRKNLIIHGAFGPFKELRCKCGAPLPALPTRTKPVRCQYCGTQWIYEDLEG